MQDRIPIQEISGVFEQLKEESKIEIVKTLKKVDESLIQSGHNKNSFFGEISSICLSHLDISGFEVSHAPEVMDFSVKKEIKSDFIQRKNQL